VRTVARSWSADRMVRPFRRAGRSGLQVTPWPERWKGVYAMRMMRHQWAGVLYWV
jgi:hypothetical protein